MRAKKESIYDKSAEEVLGVRMKVDVTTSTLQPNVLLKRLNDCSLYAEWVDDTHQFIYYYEAETKDLESTWRYPLKRNFQWKEKNKEYNIKLIDHIPNFKKLWDFICLPIGGEDDNY